MVGVSATASITSNLIEPPQLSHRNGRIQSKNTSCAS
jgi:hypothetical protein